MNIQFRIISLMLIVFLLLVQYVSGVEKVIVKGANIRVAQNTVVVLKNTDLYSSGSATFTMFKNSSLRANGNIALEDGYTIDLQSNSTVEIDTNLNNGAFVMLSDTARLKVSGNLSNNGLLYNGSKYSMIQIGK